MAYFVCDAEIWFVDTRFLHAFKIEEDVVVDVIIIFTVTGNPFYAIELSILHFLSLLAAVIGFVFIFNNRPHITQVIWKNKFSAYIAVSFPTPVIFSP